MNVIEVLWEDTEDVTAHYDPQFSREQHRTGLFSSLLVSTSSLIRGVNRHWFHDDSLLSIIPVNDSFRFHDVS